MADLERKTRGTGHAVFVCSLHLAKGGTAEAAASLTGQMHAMLDASLRVNRWRTALQWTLLTSHTLTGADTFRVDAYVIVRRRSTRRNDNVFATWKRLLVARIPQLNMSAAQRGAWCEVGARVQALVDCTPQSAAYAEVVAALCAKLAPATRSDDLTVAPLQRARGA